MRGRCQCGRGCLLAFLNTDAPQVNSRNTVSEPGYPDGQLKVCIHLISQVPVDLSIWFRDLKVVGFRSMDNVKLFPRR
jgi:hypothetical protein